MPQNVYLVPGLFGTGLITASTTLIGPKGSVFWVSKRLMSVFLLDPMRLDAAGDKPSGLLAVEMVPEGLLPPLEWQSLRNGVADADHHPIDWPWDWRKDLRNEATDLANEIAFTSLTDDFSIVCHSAGAMVTILAWDALPARAKARCKRVVWVDPCLGGSYDAVRGLAGSYWSMYGFGWLSQILSSILPHGSAPFLFPIGQQERLDMVVASWPGLYQLLPNPGDPWVGLDQNLQAIYDRTRWVSSNANITQANLNIAAATQAAVIAALNKPHPPSVVVRGPEAVTAFRIAAPELDLDDMACYDFGLQGDGVIPYVRMDLAGERLLEVSGAHQTIIGNPQLADRITDLIDTGLTSNVEVQPVPQQVGVKTLTPPAGPTLFIPPPFPPTDSHVDP
jgi:hypothetical protein